MPVMRLEPNGDTSRPARTLSTFRWKENDKVLKQVRFGLWSVGILWATFLFQAPGFSWPLQDEAVAPQTKIVATGPNDVWKLLELPAPTPNTPYANPPQLELLFDDRFLQDSTKEYEFGAKENALSWEPGCLTLLTGAKLSRHVNSHNWVELEFSFHFPELTEDGQRSELKLLLDSEPTSSGYLMLRQVRRAGETESELALYETPAAEQRAAAFPLPQKVHSESRPGPLSNGPWKITYSGGVWLIDGFSAPLCWPSTRDSDSSHVRSISLACQGQPIGLTRYAVQRVSFKEGELTPSQQRAWKRTQLLADEVPRLFAQQKLEQVAPLLREWLSLQLQELGIYHPATATCLHYQAAVLDSLGRIADSIAVREEALRIFRSVYSGPHRNVAMAHNNLGDAYKLAGDLAQAQFHGESAVAMYRRIYSGDHPELAGAINNLATIHEALGKWTAVEQDYVEVVGMLRRIFREDHVYLAISLNNLAQIRTRLGKGDEAELLYEESLAILRRLFPGDDVKVALSLHNLAHLRALLGKGPEAEPLSVEALEMFQRLYAGDHPDLARAKSTLAFVYDSVGKTAEAELLYDESLQMIRRLFPGDHPDLALALNNLADVRRSLGREEEAEQLFGEALTMRRRLFPGDHPDVATSIENLAMTLHALGRSAEAEPMCVDSLAMYRRLLPEAHPNIAKSLHNLAAVREALGQVGDAIQLYDESLTMFRRIYPGDHPGLAKGLESLANAHRSVGHVDDAERLADEAVAMNRRLYPGAHPDLASSLAVLAAVRTSQGRFAAAKVLCEEAVAISSQLLENAATFQSEAMQIAMAAQAKNHLMNYFSVVLVESQPVAVDVPEALMEQALRLKGAVFMRQRWSRLAQTATEVETRPILTQLQNVAGRLGHLQRNPPPESDRLTAWRQQIMLAQNEFTSLQQQLSAASAEFRSIQGAHRASWSGIETQLGEDVAIVDLHEYWKETDKKNEFGVPLVSPAYAALIVRPGTKPQLVELGFCSQIDQAVATWRETRGGVSGELDAGAELRRLLWEPLIPHLANVNTVLISPTGSTALIPWSALPGETEGTYLLEKYAIAVLPVPQLLGSSTPANRGEDSASMLVVADIDYGAEPGAQATAVQSKRPRSDFPKTGGARVAWSPLPNARTEATGVRDSFERAFPSGELRWLRGASATEQGTREGLENCRFVHLVTHGFFDEPSSASVGDSWRGTEAAVMGTGNLGPLTLDPLLFSGLVFAGANRVSDEGQDDGILLAIDVSVLDLRNVELAVLSACETGLGREVSGEGVLGLQRAFQVAGAETTVTSLWKVDDAATQQLMNMFYENLWHGGMSKLEALRQAQLSLLRERRLRGGEDELPVTEPATIQSWAAWVLAGDWR